MSLTIASTEASDREQFAGYVSARLAEFRQYAGVNSFVWDVAALQRARRKGRGPARTGDDDVYAGAWHVVRPYVTTEFRDWVDAYGHRRMTFTEWQREAIAARDAERTAEQEYVDSTEFALDELQTIRDAIARRDAWIVTARDRGATWAAIGEAIGMSRAQLHNVVAQYRANNPAPDYVPNAWSDDEPF